MSNFVGLDVGGTKIYAARFSDGFVVEMEELITTPENKKGDEVVLAIKKLLRNLVNDDTKAIGISWAGFVDFEKNLIVKSPNIEGCENLDLVEILKNEFSIPAVIENDARLFALAEKNADEKEDIQNMIGIILGTGVGCGLILNGEIFRGANGHAGEIGHTLSSLDGDVEIEDLLSGPAIARLLKENTDLVSGDQLMDAWPERSDELVAVLEPYICNLAGWIYNLSLTFNPQKIVFGGGVGKNVLALFEGDLKRKVDEIISKSGYPLKIDIGFSKIENSGARGAAILAVTCFN